MASAVGSRNEREDARLLLNEEGHRCREAFLVYAVYDPDRQMGWTEVAYVSEEGEARTASLRRVVTVKGKARVESRQVESWPGWRDRPPELDGLAA